jgi:formamidopyrimidine-DNA glycosylase
MPELPEVETIRRDLERGILKAKIKRIEVRDQRVLRQDLHDFTSRLEGRTIVAIKRLGKALIFNLDSDELLVVAVMMTGQLVINGTPDKHTRLIFNLSTGTLLYNDQRVFGQLRVVKHLNEIKYFNILGPEPLSQDFSEPYIAEKLKKTKRPVKNILLDHMFVAGIGNIYACEILFRSGINPRRTGDKIKKAEIGVLKKHIVETLQEAIGLRGSSMRNYRDGAGQKGRFNERLQVYAREKDPCPVCKAAIQRIIQAGRSTFYCMKCQK